MTYDVKWPSWFADFPGVFESVMNAITVLNLDLEFLVMPLQDLFDWFGGVAQRVAR